MKCKNSKAVNEVYDDGFELPVELDGDEVFDIAEKYKVYKCLEDFQKILESRKVISHHFFTAYNNLAEACDKFGDAMTDLIHEKKMKRANPEYYEFIEEWNRNKEKEKAYREDAK